MRGIGVRDAEVEALNARIKELEEELARLRVDRDALNYDVVNTRNRAVAAEAARDELARALQRYGTHDRSCAVRRQKPGGIAECDCGFRTVPSLSSEATKGEVE